jgi:hypothetical protein
MTANLKDDQSSSRDIRKDYEGKRNTEQGPLFGNVGRKLSSLMNDMAYCTQFVLSRGERPRNH